MTFLVEFNFLIQKVIDNFENLHQVIVSSIVCLNTVLRYF